MSCGGTTDVKKATGEIQELCDKVKPHAESKSNAKYDTFEAVEYTSQTVAGTNYFVKVHVGSENYAHLRIFKPLPHTNEDPSLHSIQTDKKKEDQVAFF